MKRIALVAAAALMAASAFAQSTVQSSTGASVSSGTGTVVTPGAPSASVTVMPSTSTAVMPSHHLLPGGTMVQSGHTTVLGGPPGTAASTKTEITTYWANVPADVHLDGNFQRWQRLR
jgi:hypothetical protein